MHNGQDPNVKGEASSRCTREARTCRSSWAVGVWGVGLAATIHGASVFAQTITTEPVSPPVSAAPVPADGFWLLALLACALAAMGVWVIRSSQSRLAVRGWIGMVLTVCVWAAVGHNVSVQAALALWLLSFTQADGQTLSIPVLPSPATGQAADFTPVQFNNDSGVALKIKSLTGPDSPAVCFPNGIPSNLPATPLPQAAMACNEGLLLARGASCTVDVAALCVQGVTLISVSPQTLIFSAGSTGTLTITAHAGAAQPAADVLATLPAGSALTVQSSTCAALLAPGSSCTITLASSTAEGAVHVSIGGSNTNTLAAEITVSPGASYSVGGTVSGVAGANGKLQLNGADDLPLCNSGPFTFSQPVASGSPYNVTISALPSGQTCTVSNGTGVMGTANVTNVIIQCTAAQQGTLVTKGWGC